MNEQEREAFEAWCRTCEGHPFAGAFLNLMWKAWQARAALPSAPAAEPVLYNGYRLDPLTEEEVFRFMKSVGPRNSITARVLSRYWATHPLHAAEATIRDSRTVEPTEEMVQALMWGLQCIEREFELTLAEAQELCRELMKHTKVQP